MDEADDFLMGGGIPSAKFPKIGTVVKGKVLSKELRQQTDMDTQELKFWADGRPMMQLRVVVQTDDVDPEIEDDDGQRAFYISYKMKEAVQKAVKASGAKTLEVGGELAIKFTDQEKPKKRGHNGTKLYRAKYTAPDPAAFLAEDDGMDDDADEVETPAPKKVAAKKAPAKKAAPAKKSPVDEFSDDGEEAADDTDEDDGF